jgi:hypothetical protein
VSAAAQPPSDAAATAGPRGGPHERTAGTMEPHRPGPLLRWGLARDPAATSHLTGFLASAVVTVLLVRAFLAAAGYPQIGGGGLHIAHVLWGGLLMALAFVLLLSFAGPVARPIGAVVGGIGFGLFVDEVGKFVTSDNDYFYEPTAALIYVVVVVLALVGEVLHGRRPHHPSEHLAGAADQAVAGLVGGFTTRTRAQARELLQRAGPVRGSAEVRALLDVVEEDSAELVNPIDAVAGAIVRVLHRVVSARWVPYLAVGVLTLTGLLTVGRGVYAWWAGADVPGWIVVGLLASGAVSVTFAFRGLLVVRRDRWSGYVAFRRAVLVSLLVTQVFLFRIEEWAATGGLLADLAVLGLVSVELSQMDAERRERAVRRTAGRVR